MNLTPEQLEKYRRTGCCPSCDSNEIQVSSRDEEWDLDDAPEDSGLIVSKCCNYCGTTWDEVYGYTLTQVVVTDPDEEETA